MRFIARFRGAEAGRHYINALTMLNDAQPGGAAAFTDELVSAARALRVAPPDAAAIAELRAAYDALA